MVENATKSATKELGQDEAIKARDELLRNATVAIEGLIKLHSE